MKFGGTSVEDAQAMKRTTGIVRGRRERGLGNSCGRLGNVQGHGFIALSAASAGGRGDKAGALAIGARLRHRHIDTSRALLEQERFNRVEQVLHQEFDALDDLLRGIAAVGELTPRTSDLVVSFGERLSSRMIAEAFEQYGLNGVHVDARSCIITDASYGKAIPQESAIEAKLAEIVLPLVEAGKTPVLGGFIGATEEGITTTAGPWWQRLYCCFGRRRHACRCNRDLDRRQWHHDDGPANLPGCAKGQDDQF